MINAISILKNRFINARWLIPALVVSIVFMPNSLLLIKLFGIIVALFLFYQSIDLNRNSSSSNPLQ